MEENKKRPKPLFCILDIEASSVHVDSALVLEIALAVVKPYSLEVRAKASAIVAYPGVDPSLYMDDTAKAMHEANGLLRAVREAAEERKPSVNGRDVVYGRDEAEKWILAQLEPFEGRPLHLVGNSVHYDRDICRRVYPKVFSRFSHQLGDLTSVYLFQRTWGDPPKSVSVHRAMEDVERTLGFLHQARDIFIGKARAAGQTPRDRYEAWTLFHGSECETPDWVWKGGTSGDARIDRAAERICMLRSESRQDIRDTLKDYATHLRSTGFNSDALIHELMLKLSDE